MARLQDRVYGTRSAFLSGLAVPGLGQMTTGRPVVGVALLGAAGAAAVFGLQTKEALEVREFRDPFGQPYLDTIPKTTRPNLTAAAAAAAVLWVGAAWEALAYAQRSRRHAESIIAPPEGERRATLHLGPGPRGGAVLSLRVSFGGPGRPARRAIPREGGAGPTR
jgi:hypothetical protein